MLLLLWGATEGSTAVAQERVSLGGRVTQVEDQEPIPYAHVLIKELNIWGFSNNEGDFLIEKIIPGTYTLEITSLGYQKRSATTPRDMPL